MARGASGPTALTPAWLCLQECWGFSGRVQGTETLGRAFLREGGGESGVVGPVRASWGGYTRVGEDTVTG